MALDSGSADLQGLTALGRVCLILILQEGVRQQGQSKFQQKPAFRRHVQQNIASMMAAIGYPNI